MTNHPCNFRLPRNATRRDIMKYGLAAAGIVALGPLGGRRSEALGAPMPNHKRFIVINMVGGCDTLNMVVPKGLAEYYSVRGSLAIPANAALPLKGTSLYGLTPVMPKVAALWNADDALAVQRVGYPREDLSHFVSQDVHSLGVRDAFASLQIARSGWIARYADFREATRLSAVAIGMGRPLDLVGGVNHGLAVDSLAAFQINAPAAQLKRIAATKDIIRDSVTSGLTYEARGALFDAYDLVSQVQTALTAHDSYAATSGIVWPKNPIANRMKDVAALIHGGFDTRIFYTGFGNFDTHGNQGTVTPGSGIHPLLLSQLDGAIGAFADEMKLLGVWDDVVILVMTEFGRRTQTNYNGTEHGHAYSPLVIGGAVKGGRSYGPDLIGSDLMNSKGYVDYAVDFRSVYKDIVRDHLGGDANAVFPEPQTYNVSLDLV